MVKSVLVIDDDAAIRETLGEIVTLEGYHPVFAENGADALSKLRSGNRPGLILLDLMMPVMDGFEFRVQQLKDPRLASIPTIVLSAIGNLRDATSKLDTGVTLIRKPPELEDLLKMIREKMS